MNMRATIVQSDIAWEDKPTNLRHYDSLLAPLKGLTDLVVLPEMCTTGFSMNTESMAETNYGETVNTLRQMAKEYDFAITGSFIGKDTVDQPGETAPFFNRAFFIAPDGNESFYDKRHLFRMGDEPKHYSAGKNRCLIHYKDWNIRLIVCYDLRFPVWCRNINNEYDLLIVMANWPKARTHAWKSLLTARAIENMAYVCGVNRIGLDGLNISYSGDSQLIDAYGNQLLSAPPSEAVVQTFELNLDALHHFRKKFPAWMDADRFQLL